jgi:outer membrane protein assembly factor BamB
MQHQLRGVKTMRWMRFCWIVLLCVIGMTAWADDWPQWLGSQRDSVWREDGIVRRIPEKGLPVLWRTKVGLGYAGPAVADGRVYVMDYLLKSGKVTNNPDVRDKTTGKERVLCLQAKTGKILWKHEYDRSYSLSFAGGPRTTPTVVDGKVYALGAEGNLWCLDARTGKVIWSVDYAKDYGAKTPIWGFASHPLVDDDLLYCIVGGEGSVAVAFNKNTGKEVWRALSSREPGYCPPSIIEHAGVRQLLIWNSESLNSLDLKTGKVYWTAALKPYVGMAIAAPRKWESYLLASNFGVAALLKLADDKPGAEILWRGEPKNAIYSANVTPFIDDGTIYGCDIETGALMGVDLKDGTRLWQTTAATFGGPGRARYGTAFVVKNGDRFVLFNEKGDLILANLTRKGYEEVGRQHVLEPTNVVFERPVVWSHPAFANRCVYARNDKELVCVSMAEKAASPR